jgi:hypothetical protein
MSVIRKSDELGIIWGYASVADIEDLQGDTVPQDELVNAVYQFMQDYYASVAEIRDNHGDEPAPVVLVESTFHFVGMKLRWFVGVKLNSDELKEAARNGEISGFSIGGWAIDEEAEA